MTKINLLLLASLMVTTTAMADGGKKKKKVSKLDDGKVHGYVRLHHIFEGEDNGFDKTTGSTIGLGLKYGTSLAKHLAVGGEFYGVTQTALQKDTGVAFGQGMGESKKDDAVGSVTGLHVTLQNLPAKSRVSFARSQFKSPMTKIQITHVPNMYEFVRGDTGVLGGNLSLSFITDMAYGSRSAADFGLIGEKTGTAGMAITPFKNPKSASLKRGEYYSISNTTTGTEDTSGIAVLGYERKIGNLKLNVWDFKAENILNNLFVEADYKIKMGKGKAVVLSGQYLDQTIDDSSLNNAGNSYGGAFYGVQAKLKYNQLVLKAAYNKKDDEGGFYNAWGANPGYTSSIFSRNEYRTNVSAYKATAVYLISKNLKVMVSHADYGQSDMKVKTANGFKGTQADASETDMAVIYKPRKNVMLKLFNANRTSEFDGLGGNEKTQNHTRLIANIAF